MIIFQQQIEIVAYNLEVNLKTALSAIYMFAYNFFFFFNLSVDYYS